MRKPWLNVCFFGSLSFYVFILMWIIVFKNVTPEVLSGKVILNRSINLIPFNDLINGNYIRFDLWGNIIIFIPLGIYISIFFHQSNLFKNTLKVLGISLLFESIQYVFAIGAADITDIITNTAGGILGIGVYYLLKKLIKNHNGVKKFITVSSTAIMLPLLILIIVLVAYN